jgi:hypothetical protein
MPSTAGWPLTSPNAIAACGTRASWAATPTARRATGARPTTGRRAAVTVPPPSDQMVGRILDENRPQTLQVPTPRCGDEALDQQALPLR